MNVIFAIILIAKRSKLMKNMPLRISKILLRLIFIPAIVLLTDNQLFAQEYKIKTIVIDAGHGGIDGTTRGLKYTEKDLALKTALALGAAIEQELKDVKVIYTRTTDVFIPLYERINIANEAKADLFISIHLNDMAAKAVRVPNGYKTVKGKRVTQYKTVYRKPTSVRGTETFVSGLGRVNEQDEVIKRENASMFLEDNYEANYSGFVPNDPENAIILSLMKNAYRTQSLNLAKLIQEEYVAVGRINRGVQEKSLAVLARAGMPAVLTEIGFLSNPEEEEYMASESGQIEIVNCLLRAIKAYKTQIEI